MEPQNIAICAEDIPDSLPIFPLNGSILLPGAFLPLNIFEPRYLDMCNDALKSNRLIGMIQTRSGDTDAPLYQTGCAGKITTFHETEDGRYLITLSGVARFTLAEELDTTTAYRQVKIDKALYQKDIEAMAKQELFPPFHDWNGVCDLLKVFFAQNELENDWTIILDTPKRHLLNALCTICPFDVSEKQALLEAENPEVRFALLKDILNMAISSSKSGAQLHH